MQSNFEIDSCRKLLNEIAEMSEEASLTGSLSGGNQRVAQRYNAILERLEKLEVVSVGLFTRLPDNASFGEIGVEARMLSSFVKRDGRSEADGQGKTILLRLAPFVDKADLAQLVREQIREGTLLDLDALTHLAPFLDKSMLGELLRERLGEIGKPTPPASAPESGRASSGSGSPTFVPLKSMPDPHPAPAPASPGRELVSIAPAEDQVDTLVDLLKNPHLSAQERDGLLERLRAVAR